MQDDAEFQLYASLINQDILSLCPGSKEEKRNIKNRFKELLLQPLMMLQLYNMTKTELRCFWLCYLAKSLATVSFGQVTKAAECVPDMYVSEAMENVLRPTVLNSWNINTLRSSVWEMNKREGTRWNLTNNKLINRERHVQQTWTHATNVEL